MRRRVWVLFCAGLGLIALAALTIGCGSSSKPKIRLVNGTPDQSGLDLLVDKNSVASGVGYGSASTYVQVSSGSRRLQVEPTGDTTILIDRTDSIGPGTDRTLVSLNYSFNSTSVLLMDDNSTPSSGNVKLRIVNASPGMGAQDVYVVTYGTDINSVNPTFSSLGFGSAAAYKTLGAGDYQVIFTPPGQKFSNLDSGFLTFTEKQVRTLLALNNPQGSYMSTVLSDLN
jgi:hypothetical protein